MYFQFRWCFYWKKNPSTHILHITYFLLLLYWLFNLILRHMWKRYVLSSEIHCVKSIASSDPHFPSTILSLYEKIRIWFCLYTGKYGSKKGQFSAYFTQWLRGNNGFKLNWLHDFKVSFFSKTDCDTAARKWNYSKKVTKTTSS